jgi:hypothetical protein
MNHWKLAVETHNTNFPNADHDCADISASDPRRYPSTDILITSPECTTHSPAGGNKHRKSAQSDLFLPTELDPATQRSRATMWDVVRFTEYHQYRAIIVENVVEVVRTWPLFWTWWAGDGDARLRRADRLAQLDVRASRRRSRAIASTSSGRGRGTSARPDDLAGRALPEAAATSRRARRGRPAARSASTGRGISTCTPARSAARW